MKLDRTRDPLPIHKFVDPIICPHRHVHPIEDKYLMAWCSDCNKTLRVGAARQKEKKTEETGNGRN